MTVPDPAALPEGLPVPIDDGAAAHLPGMSIPHISLESTDDGHVDLAEESRKQVTVVFCYPKTGRPGVEMPAGWDEIPGARGCTPEACAFRDLKADFDAIGARIYGLSTQDTEYQKEAVERLHLPYPLLSDSERGMTGAMSLPTLTVDGETLLRRMTLILSSSMVESVFYPVFPPDRHPAEVLDFLLQRARNRL